MYNRSASATGSPLGFVTTTDANSKLVWNGTLNQYTYNGKAVDTSHLYVIGGKLGVFTNYDKSEVYEGTVYGANNEILMTAMKDGTYYSYWAAPVTDPNATMETYRVSDYNKDLATLKDNDVALYHNDIKSVDMTKGGTTTAPTATITTMRNGNGTAQAVDGSITVTGGGGTNGQDTTVTLSNTNQWIHCVPSLHHRVQSDGQYHRRSFRRHGNEEPHHQRHHLCHGSEIRRG